MIQQKELGLKERIKALPVELRIMMSTVLNDELFLTDESFKKADGLDIVGDIIDHVRKYEGRTPEAKRVVDVSVAEMPKFRDEVQSLLDWTRGSVERTQVLMDKLGKVKLC